MSTGVSQWYKGQFLISTSQDLLQLDVINKAFDADYTYWVKGMSEDKLKKMLAKSLCFGVYILPESSSEIAGKLESRLSPRVRTLISFKVVDHQPRLALAVLLQTNCPSLT